MSRPSPPAVVTTPTTRCPSCRRLHATSQDWDAFLVGGGDCGQRDCPWGADRCWGQDCGIPAEAVATIAQRARQLRRRRPWSLVPHQPVSPAPQGV